jgi:outer membrane protein
VRRWPGFLAVLLCLVELHTYAQDEASVLTLKEARRVALANRPAVKAGQLSVASAQQATAAVESARYPQLWGSLTVANALRETETINGQTVTLDSRIAAGGLNNPLVLRRDAGGLFLSQLVTDFGRTTKLVESAKNSETAQQHQAIATRAQILLEVSDAYYAALAAQAVLLVATKTVDARKLLLDRVTALTQNKLRSALDVSFAQVNLGEAQLLQLKARNAVDAAFARLSTSLGYRDGRRFTLVDEASVEVPPGELGSILADAIAARPELASLRADREAARKFADAQHALRFPTINLYAAAGVTPIGDERFSNQYGAIGVNLNIPVLDGGKITALEKGAKFKAEALSEGVTEAENNVTEAVRVAWLNAKAAYENIGITSSLKDAATQALKLADSRYNLGITSIIELNQAQLSAIGAEIAYSRAKYGYLAALDILSYQVGTLDAQVAGAAGGAR